MNYLLLRGLGRQAAHWGEFKSLLEEQEFSDKVVALDLPGFGEQNTEDSPTRIKAITNFIRLNFLKQISSEDKAWTIIGFSLGGMVALDWVNRFPHDFKKIIIINSSAANLSPPWMRLRAEVFKHFLKIIKTRNTKQRETEILKMICNHDPEAYVEEWTHLAQKHPYKEINVIKQLGAALSFTAPKTLNISGLVLSSTQDRMVHYSCSKKLSKRFNWPIQLHKSAGHDLTTDDPKWVITEIKQDNENS
ncbi:MAG: alpha/beta hydrolase [Bdellovibrionales bacterium]|nr:alpha/beta hydrolase [Bdellovibrionales bacterium]